MAYLTRWRLQLGAQLLTSTSHSVAQIAAEVGYESEPAFNRAFKREFGSPLSNFARAGPEGLQFMNSRCSIENPARLGLVGSGVTFQSRLVQLLGQRSNRLFYVVALAGLLNGGHALA